MNVDTLYKNSVSMRSHPAKTGEDPLMVRQP